MNTNDSNFSRFLLHLFNLSRSITEPIIHKQNFFSKSIEIWNNYTDVQKNEF